MIIDGHTIGKMIDKGEWLAYRDKQLIESKDLSIGPNSVDITLGEKMLVPRTKDHRNTWVDVVDYHDDLEWEEIHPVDGKFSIRPGSFQLATVRERFDVSKAVTCVFLGEQRGHVGGYSSHALCPLTFFVAPMFEGKSTMARLGLAMHVTAGMGQYGFDGHFTMELVNHGPLNLVLTVGMRIAQLSFQAVTPDVTKVHYCGAYANHDSGPNPPVLGRSRFLQQPAT